MTIKVVGVVGAGLMGSGIAEQAARSGYKVVVREIDDGALRSGQERIEQSVNRALERGKISQEERDSVLSRITGVTDLSHLSDCDLVIEAIVEQLGAKLELFRALDHITRPHVILASNTSSVSITSLAAATERPERVAGAHFFNPVPVMKLVELVRALQTSDETLATLRAFGTSMGKTVVVTADAPGFIVNYLLIPYLLDAVRMLERGSASREDIDAAISLGLNHPMGPLTLIDHIGVDTTLNIAEVMYTELRDPKYVAPPLLKQMVLAGRLGRKRGHGFYEYGAHTHHVV